MTGRYERKEVPYLKKILLIRWPSHIVNKKDNLKIKDEAVNNSKNFKPSLPLPSCCHRKDVSRRSRSGDLDVR